MRKRTFVTHALLAALCLSLLGGCGSPEEPDAQGASGYWETQEFDTISGTGFVKVAESGGMQLLVEPNTGTVRWLDTATGVYQDSNMSHNEDLENKSDATQSDLMVRYFSGSTKSNKLYYQTSSYDSYSMCSSREQLSYQLIDNGVRILYTLGTDDMTYKDFPREISDERMQELVLQYLSEADIRKLKASYYTQMNTGEWIRKLDEKAGGLAMKQITQYFYETGHYTYEALLEDLEALEAEPNEYPDRLRIRVPVEYYLDNGELVVNVDTSRIESAADHPVNQLVLLPYFLTSNPAKDAEEGYMFLPDRSGALIYLDSTKAREYHFAGSFYGGDRLVNAATYNSVDSKMMMPVFGMKNEHSTIFAVIEDGAEAATLDAYVSGTDNSEPFSKIKLTFDIQTQQSMSSGLKNANGDFTMYRASDDVYDDNITIRYFWLGEEGNYVDMADCYAEYLTRKGVLAAREEEDVAPFYVELLGSTDKTMYMLGIPYEGTQTLTTFDQAREILTDLSDGGMQNLKVIYSGMVNGGMNQRSLASGVKLVSGLGGSSDFKKLKSYADSVGAQLFPNLQLQTVYTKTKVNNEMAAWNIINERGQIYSFNPIDNSVETEADYPLYLVNPNYVEKYLGKVKKSYSKRTGLTTIASNDLYTFVPTTYRDNHVSPSSGDTLLKEAVNQFAEGMTVMLSNPSSEAYGYSTYLTDIPTTDSGMRVLDASIPFMGMVLDGHKVYSSESLNKESTDVYVNFMHVLESNSAPKFTFMYEDSSILSGTEQENYFAVEYSYWKDRIGAYYEEYKAFYNLVKGAKIVDHELYGRNEKLRVVTYSNGVKVYFNYSDLEEQIDGVTVPAFSYVTK